MLIPDPKLFHDGLTYLRDLHARILTNCDSLEGMLTDAEKQGLFPSFAANSAEWNDLFTFFSKVTARHEMDEEEYLFPILIQKLPRIGFQPPDSPIRFLVDGHDVLKNRVIPLMRIWNSFHSINRDPGLLQQAAKEHAEADRQFIAEAREMIALYREHISIEETRIYPFADKSLSPTERHQIMMQLRSQYDNEASTSVPGFDSPQFSDPDSVSGPGYQVRYVSGTRGEIRDADFEDTPR